MSTIVERRWSRSRGFARGRTPAIAMAIACALQIEMHAMDLLRIDPPIGSVAGGDRVTIHVVTGRNSAVKAFHFGRTRVPAEKKADPSTFSATTPPHGGGGDAVIPGVYEQTVKIEFENGNAIAAGSFIYIDKTHDPAQGIVSLKPAHGRVAGGEHVAIQAPALAAHHGCTSLQALFRGAGVEVLSSDASTGTITVVTPPIDIANTEEVPVELRCEGKTIATGTFVYTPAPKSPEPPPPHPNGVPIATTVAVGAVLAAELLWLFRRLQALIGQGHPPSTQPAVEKGSDVAETLQRFADEHRRAMDALQRSLVDAVATISKEVERLRDGGAKANESGGTGETDTLPKDRTRKPVGSTTQSLQQREQTKPEASRSNGTKQASTKRSTDTAAPFSPERLADMWNEERRSGGSSGELIRSLNAAWPGKVVARALRGLIVVTVSNEDATFVLPSMQPLVHEATIQEFFEVRPAGDGKNTRVVHPARVPRGTDLDGFTAGQITRGILEA